MKIIAIYLDDGKTIHINDENDESIEEYSNNLSSILEETNVVVLTTSESCLIVRPTRINGINVKEDSNVIDEEDVSILKNIDISDEPVIKEELIEPVKILKDEKIIEEEEDVITDE